MRVRYVNDVVRCTDCNEPRFPTHMIQAAGPTVRHPFQSLPYAAAEAMEVYLHMTDGSVRVLTYDCNTEDAFDALKRAYRSEDNDFMVYEIAYITFQN